MKIVKNVPLDVKVVQVIKYVAVVGLVTLSMAHNVQKLKDAKVIK